MNRVILMGRLTNDPELRYATSNNIPVCRFRLAVNRPYAKSREENQTDFFTIIAWRGRAEFCSKYFKKGMRVLIEGSIRNNIYEDKDGVRHHTEEIYVDNCYFADSKRDNNTNNTLETTNQFSKTEAPVPAETGDGFYALNEDDDELPF